MGPGTNRILTVSKGCVAVTAPQAAMPPAMKALAVQLALCFERSSYALSPYRRRHFRRCLVCAPLLLPRLRFYPPRAFVTVLVRAKYVIGGREKKLRKRDTSIGPSGVS